jgi:hypothetical protein
MGVAIDERTALRGAWNDLWAEWQSYQARCGWLYRNQQDPEWKERDEETRLTGLRVGAARDLLAERCGVTGADVTLLLGSVAEAEEGAEA